MRKYLTEDFGNPSSIHSFGRTARVAVEEAREITAKFINADPSEIYFTGSGTEANNFSILGIAKTEFYESGKKTIITSKAEHHSVYDTFCALGNHGFNVRWLDVDSESKAKIETLTDLIDDSTSLLSLIHINNETGAINPIGNIKELCKGKEIFFHTDTVQSFGKTTIDVTKLGIDSLSASAHKIGGPKGIGFAYVKSGTPLASLIVGGPQERNRRAGTENVAGIVGFAEAIKIAQSEMHNNYEKVKKLRDSFIKGIMELDSHGIRINGGENVSPYILSITIISEYYRNDPESMLMFLDINGIAVSNGAACTSGALKPSHVILNSGFSEEDAAGTIRFSFSAQNRIYEVNYALDILQKMIKKFKK
jgi:cysteine desulfurase